MICALTFLSALSDNLFLVYVLVPFIATAILEEVASADAVGPRRRSRMLLLWAVLTLVVPVMMYRMTIPPPAVNVAWSLSVDDRQRTTLEARYHLADGDFRGGRLWTYRITDTTRENVSALVRDSNIEDTGFERLPLPGSERADICARISRGRSGTRE